MQAQREVAMKSRVNKEVIADMREAVQGVQKGAKARFNKPAWAGDPAQIKAARQALMITQQEFAHGLGVSIKTAEYWQRTGRVPLWAQKVLNLISHDPGFWAKFKNA
jgi:DNA-binding transcriptional regulator YiaG